MISFKNLKNKKSDYIQQFASFWKAYRNHTDRNKTINEAQRVK